MNARLFSVAVVTIILSKSLSAQWVSAGSSIYYDNGSVGIGTQNPFTILEVKKANQGTLGPVLRLTGGGGLGAQCAIDLTTYDAGTSLPAGRMVATDDGAFGCTLDFQSKQSGILQNPMQSRLFISNIGNVGIGNTSPGSKLHVDGNGFFNDDLTVGAENNIMGYGKKVAFGYNSNSDPLWLSRYNVSSDASELRVNVSDDGQSTDRFAVGYTSIYDGLWRAALFVSADGKVGINTEDTKGYSLGVNGNAIFNKVVVKPYPWSDYVFNNNYRLRPLSEVEQYIKQYHHLPEVVSAGEVEKNGVDVGDNQATLLKKIEELTLYVIEQDKQIKKLANENREMELLKKEVEELKALMQQIRK